jgi:hypothetical protein
MNEVSHSNEGLARRLANLKPFPKGVSGNPGGKSKHLEELRKLALENCPRALKRIVELVESEDERVAMMAAKEILDRGIGKPKNAEDGDEANAKSLTINIIRYTDGDKSPAQLESTAISVRTVEIPGGGREEGSGGLSS